MDLTTTPKIQPASDADLAVVRPLGYRCIGCVLGTPPETHGSACIFAMEPKLLARIEADRADVGRLRARVAELEAALSELETRIFALGSDGPICQLHRLKLSALVDFIRAALKPEPR